MEPKTQTFDQSQNNITFQLQILLANTYLLLLKTQNFHWNVIGPRFQQLHLFFESQYEELFNAVDLIAEQIRILRERPAASFQEYLNLSTLVENESQLNENQMLQNLYEDHQELQKSITDAIEICHEANDEGTADLLIDRLRAHEKMAWMIHSHLEK